jgi:2-polyprenyl-6-methoxyphenol hydroxylase-like FAD-dependent oxidoreductase
MYWLATLVDQERALDPAGRAGYMRDAFAGFAPQVRELIEATDPASIVQSRIRDRDPIDTWGSGRITLLGDAIHPSTPDVGQGACQAMEDAVVLAARLADAPDAVAGLRAYEEQRRRRAASNAERRSSLLFGN